MTPRLYFWTFALVVFAAMVGSALMAFREVRRGRVQRHRRFMNIAVGLVVLFVVAYAAKLAVLGREDRSSWSAEAVLVLRLHETMIAAMLLAGGIARWLGRGVRSAPAVVPEMHRWLGRAALTAGLLALATASLVWWGMVERNQLGDGPRAARESPALGQSGIVAK